MNGVLNQCWHDRATASASDTTTQTTRYCHDCGLTETTFATPSHPAPAQKVVPVAEPVGLLSSRLRPGIEAAPWVVEEVKKLEGRLATPASVPAPDTAWTMAIAEALGLSSGYAVPLVPDKERFIELFQQVRERAAQPMVQDAKDARSGDSVHSGSGECDRVHAPGLTDAARDVLAERARQIEIWGNDHDDEHGYDRLANGAADYLLPGQCPMKGAWSYDSKVTDRDPRRVQMVKGAALALSAIEAWDRAAILSTGSADQKGGKS